jgi:hypothetical protein
MNRDVLGKKGMDALFSSRRLDGSSSRESEVKSRDSKSEAQTTGVDDLPQVGSGQESDVKSNDSLLKSKKSRLVSSESKVMSPDVVGSSRDSRVNTNDSEVISQESGPVSSESEVKSHDSGVLTYDPKVLGLAISEANDNPRISLWSPLVMAVLRYNQLTRVRYSMSKEASTILEEAFMEKYPEICEAVKREINGAKP